MAAAVLVLAGWVLVQVPKDLSDDPPITQTKRIRTFATASDCEAYRAEAMQVGAETGATSTGAWLAHETLADRPEVVGRVKLARALDDEYPLTAQGLAAGDYSGEHAAVIVKALADLPDALDPGLRERAEKTLVEEAVHLTPRQLRTVGRHLLEVVAPEVAEARERDRLDRQDAAAYATARFSMMLISGAVPLKGF